MDQERLLEHAKARVDALCELASKLKDEPVDVDNSIPQVDDALLKRCGTNIPALINELTGHDGKMKDKNDDEGKKHEDKKDGGKDGDVPSLSEKLAESWSEVVKAYWPKLKAFFEAVGSFASTL